MNQDTDTAKQDAIDAVAREIVRPNAPADSYPVAWQLGHLRERAFRLGATEEEIQAAVADLERQVEEEASEEDAAL